ncbi:hypothetical protein ACFQ3S_05910 [Mucilaginibacter terrae]|uniref:hypothetical protein n=1 Tax=Mucilaginibacter terrae TaxID=1955052 RepID=UPI0036442D5D
MKLVIDNIKTEHYKWLMEMAKTLQFNVVEVEVSEEEQYLLTAMEEVKDEPSLTEDEAKDFENWLNTAK